MRCCLILFRSAAVSSSRRIVLRSMMLATISTYGRMCEFTRVGSSSTNPSGDSVTYSGGVSVTSWDAESPTDSAPEEFTLGALQESCQVGCPRGAGGAWTSHGEAFPVPFQNLLRLPLRRFFFLLPESVR